MLKTKTHVNGVGKVINIWVSLERLGAHLDLSCMPSDEGIDTLTEFFTRLEMRNVLAGQRNRRASFRISAHPRRPEVQRKAPESPYFYTFTVG
jgi:hypothetical protein